MRFNDNQKFRKEQLEIDRELAKVSRERLEFDKAEASSEKRFWKMSAGTRVTILVSGAAVIVSLVVGVSTVWASWITKEKEIQVSAIQHKLDQEKLDAQKKREWDLALAQFVLTNQKAIYNGTLQERQVLARIIPTIFPQDVSVTLLDRLEKTTPAPGKAIWTQAKARVEDSNVIETKEAPRENIAINKPSPYSSLSSPTLPSWMLNSESSGYGSVSLDKINGGITTGDLSRTSFTSQLNSLNNQSLGLADIAYHPSSIVGIGNPSVDISKLLAGTPPATLPDGPTILGTIIDAATGKAIPGATIELESGFSLGRIKTATDESGRFSMTVPSGSYLLFNPIQLKITGDGYKAATRDVKNYSSIIPTSLGDVALEKGTP
jgi:hypothetical protein